MLLFWQRLWEAPTRLLEVFLALNLIFRGFAWLSPSQTLEQPFYYFLRLGDLATAQMWGAGFLISGLFLLLANYINGSWPKGSPRLRQISLMFPIIIYTGLVISFLEAAASPNSYYHVSLQALFALSAVWCFINIEARGRYNATNYVT